MADPKVTQTRTQALEEAAAEARHLAQDWRSGAEGNHSSHHSELRRTWAEAAEKVAEAIAALARRDGPDGT
jgi:hypothetical protein